ncbi:MAG: hypothetical protein ACK45B_05230 [Limisphaerales bacterium]
MNLDRFREEPPQLPHRELPEWEDDDRPHRPCGCDLCRHATEGQRQAGSIADELAALTGCPKPGCRCDLCEELREAEAAARVNQPATLL